LEALVAAGPMVESGMPAISENPDGKRAFRTEKGSFTKARTAQRIGRFEDGQWGEKLIFLDEKIADMVPAPQAKRCLRSPGGLFNGSVSKNRENCIQRAILGRPPATKSAC